MSGSRPVAPILIVHIFTFKRGRDSRIHHQFRETHGRLIQRVNSAANSVIVVFVPDFDQSFF